MWVTKVELDEACPFLVMMLSPMSNGLANSCTKVDVHYAKSLKTCSLSVFESSVKVYADVEAVREAGFLIHLLMRRKLGEM